jgi:hypothetical protein
MIPYRYRWASAGSAAILAEVANEAGFGSGGRTKSIAYLGDGAIVRAFGRPALKRFVSGAALTSSRRINSQKM